MQIYPHSTPIILTETIYSEYGGQSGSASHAQLQNAFWISEKRVTDYIGTFLLSTIVTGTYPHNREQFIATDYGYVQRVLSASVLSLNNLQTCTLQTDTACVFVFNDTFGYLNLSCVNSTCGCAGWLQPYQFQIAYEAGLPTGTANLPGVEHALVIVAELALNEMAYPRANESAGDRGIEQWSAMDYSEKRKPLKRTALGQSARANYAAELLDISVKRAKRAITLR
jgi:hypothetical protein